jgi:hypothetical protein
MGIFDDGSDDEAPPINVTPYTPQQIAPEFKPINAMNWFDNISGEQFSFVRDREGNLTVNTRDTSGRTAVDAPIPMNNVNIALPEVGNLAQFNNRYAAAVATLTQELRDLGNTINIIENTAPDMIPQNRALIDSYKQASQRAIDKGFDIRSNGIDKKLRQMGLLNSSTALGSEIALSRERVDAEINNRFQTAELANKTKQQTLANQYQLGQQIVQTAAVEMNRYNSESQNELTARGQDLGREQLVQQRGSEQARLNMAQEQMRISTELANRNLRMNVMQQRNPTNAAVSMITNTNNQAIQAVSADNNAMHQLNVAEIGHGQAEVQRFQANQAAQSNPMGQLLMTGAGALLGGVGGSLGSSLGGGWGQSMGGVNPFANNRRN